ncbi:MAG: glycosyltransferase [Crocinitomicaceae bacterium]
MKRLRILHITPWFPNTDNPIEGVFIAKQLVELQSHCYNEVLHITLNSTNKMENGGNYEGLTVTRKQINPIVDRWIIKEKLASKYIHKYLKKRENDFDFVNFYIAYPNAVSLKKFQQQFPKLTFTISEQWSAYYEAFNLPPHHKGRKRIENIFKQQAPLFTVSSALAEDIKKFAGLEKIEFKLIPNIVNPNDFYYKEKPDSTIFTFSSINNWSSLKNPFVLIEAFKLLLETDKKNRLLLCGSGQLSDEIKDTIKKEGLEDHIIFKGRIPKEEVLSTLQNSHVYCQSSNYETFSAICIEALATGTPVIATKIGGMKDFVNEKNGLLIDQMTPEQWKNGMKKVKENYSSYQAETISKETIEKYNPEKVGTMFFDHFEKLVKNG